MKILFLKSDQITFHSVHRNIFCVPQKKISSLLTPLNSYFTTCKVGLLAVKKKKKGSGSYLDTHSETRQEKWRENKEERDIDTLKEMGEIEKQTEREKGRGRHPKKHSLESLGRLSRQPTVNKPPWEIQDSCTHSRTHTYILTYTTIERTKHNKKDPQYCFLSTVEEKVCCIERLQGEVFYQKCYNSKQLLEFLRYFTNY